MGGHVQKSLAVLIFTLIYYTSAIAASRIRIIPGAISARGDSLFERATSTDPSCPPGFLCAQQACPSNVTCEPGESCINFEGTLACAPKELQWCALNPSSLQGVGCNGGTCCHGNCYVKGTVCCSAPSNQCSVGKLCNACAAGQTCLSDGSCSTKSSTSSQPTSQSTSQSVSVPVSQTSSTATSSRSSTSTSTSQPPPSPTVVQSSGDFKNIGCFQDSQSAHVLVADTYEDPGTSGMTVEKCVSFARKSAWQYAGVESGSLCLVGNSLHNPQSAAASDCNTRCSGNALELCGGSSRLQIYQDATWYQPTGQDIIGNLTKYNNTLASANSALSSYQADLKQFKKDGGVSADASKAKRQVGAALSAAQRLDFQNIKGDFGLLKVFQDQLDLEAQILLRLFQLAKMLDLPIPANPAKGFPVSQKTYSDLQTGAVDAQAQAVGKTVSTGSSDQPVIDTALRENTMMALRTEAEIAVAADAVIAIGVWADVAAAATGIFGVLAALLAEFATAGGGGPGSSTNPPTSTRTTTSTSSSSSRCTSTATQTPIVIVTKSDTTSDQFNQLVASLPKSSVSQTFTPKEGRWWLIATLDQCTSEALWKNSNVDRMAIDSPVLQQENSDQGTTSTGKLRRRADHQQSSPVKPLAQRSGATVKNNLVLDDATHIVTETNAPDNLNWISGLSRQSGLTGKYYDFEKFAYDDSGRQSVQLVSWVYYIDGTGFAIHSDYSDRIRWHINANLGAGDPTLTPTGSHGTSMVSCAAGTYAGPAKNALIGLVRLQSNSRGNMPVSSVMFAFDQIILHSSDANSRTRAIIGMSFSAPVTLLWWPHPDVQIPPNGNDVFTVKLNEAYAVGLAVATSSGNLIAGAPAQYAQLGSQAPTNSGGSFTPLIVVGNSNLDNTRYTTSRYLDQDNLGILSLYAVGVDCVCGGYTSSAGNNGNEQTAFELLTGSQQGTSQATAQTVGIVANMIADPRLRGQLTANGRGGFAMAVKQALLSMSTANKGNFTDSVPRLSNGVAIPCPPSAAAVQGRPPAPNPVQAPALQNGLRPVLREVASGTTVTYQNPPQCYNLS